MQRVFPFLHHPASQARDEAFFPIPLTTEKNGKSYAILAMGDEKFQTGFTMKASITSKSEKKNHTKLLKSPRPSTAASRADSTRT